MTFTFPKTKSISQQTSQEERFGQKSFKKSLILQLPKQLEGQIFSFLQVCGCKQLELGLWTFAVGRMSVLYIEATFLTNKKMTGPRRNATPDLKKFLILHSKQSFQKSFKRIPYTRRKMCQGINPKSTKPLTFDFRNENMCFVR